MLLVTLGCMLDGLVVEAMMLEELGILTGHHSLRHRFGYLIERHPVMRQLKVAPLSDLLITPDEHQGREEYRHKAEHHN